MPTRPRGQTVVTTLGNRTTVTPAPARSRSVASTTTVPGLHSQHATARLIGESSRRITQLESRALSDLFGSGVLLRNLKVVGSLGVTYIQHRLGRPYTGYWITRTVGSTLVGNPIEQTLPSNMSSSVWIALIFQTNVNTYDLFVF